MFHASYNYESTAGADATVEVPKSPFHVTESIPIISYVLSHFKPTAITARASSFIDAPIF